MIHFFLIGPIPETLGNCIELTELYLNVNKLEGACRIHHTMLPPKGEIPNSLGNCTKLKYLSLLLNQLEGKLHNPSHTCDLEFRNFVFAVAPSQTLQEQRRPLRNSCQSAAFLCEDHTQASFGLYHNLNQPKWAVCSAHYPIISKKNRAGQLTT
jgi:hypothetical protein